LQENDSKIIYDRISRACVKTQWLFSVVSYAASPTWTWWHWRLCCREGSKGFSGGARL